MGRANMNASRYDDGLVVWIDTTCVGRARGIHRLVTFNLEKVKPHLRRERLEDNLGKTTLCASNWDSNPELHVNGRRLTSSEGLTLLRESPALTEGGDKSFCRGKLDKLRGWGFQLCDDDRFDGRHGVSSSALWGISGNITDTTTPSAVPDECFCNQGTFPCANMSVCIPQRSMCNGYNDCPRGEDEDVIACADFHGNIEFLTFLLSSVSGETPGYRTCEVSQLEFRLMSLSGPACPGEGQCVWVRTSASDVRGSHFGTICISGFPQNCSCRNVTWLSCKYLGLSQVPQTVTRNVTRIAQRRSGNNHKTQKHKKELSNIRENITKILVDNVSITTLEELTKGQDSNLDLRSGKTVSVPGSPNTGTSPGSDSVSSPDRPKTPVDTQHLLITGTPNHRLRPPDLATLEVEESQALRLALALKAKGIELPTGREKHQVNFLLSQQSIPLPLTTVPILPSTPLLYLCGISSTRGTEEGRRQGVREGPLGTLF
uniref:Uncharacterized protein n=1 Tax=Timema douglasi TaxID=61478 RepID=A0A7R8Z828_TIMDO|nr:unnamed protein product [Timema douglasi]